MLHWTGFFPAATILLSVILADAFCGNVTPKKLRKETSVYDRSILVTMHGIKVSLAPMLLPSYIMGNLS